MQQFSGGRSGARGRGRSKLQCQLCGKNGHSVDRCWHRFDQSFSGVLAQDHDSRADAHANMPFIDNNASCYGTCCNSRV
ncbi:hypothetical protein GQ457_17G007930 [Hibiscus cannabinus]